MSLDQAHRLRQLARSAGASASAHGTLPMVVVSGGKGGVGTSTVAMELATAVARFGKRAVLVEADLDRGGRVKQYCDGASIADCLAGRQSVREALERGDDGIWILPGAWAPQDLTECTATSQERLIEEMRALAAHADVLIVDAGSSRNPFVRRFWRVASMVLVVTTPDNAAVMDSYAAIKVLLAGDTSIPVYTLVNFADDISSAQFVHERVRVTCKRFLGVRTSCLGEVPPLPKAPVDRYEQDVRSKALHGAFDKLAGTLSQELGLPAIGSLQKRAAC